MSNRLPNSQPPDGSGVPVPLRHALDNLNRIRGSSATPIQSGPSLLSPQPQRGIQAQIESMNKEMGRTSINQGKQNQTMASSNRGGSNLQDHGDHQRSRSSSNRSSVSNQDQGVKFGNHGRDFSSSQSISTQKKPSSGSIAGSGTFKFPPGSLNQAYARRTMVNEFAARFQEKFMEIQKLISRTPNIPNNVQEGLNSELQKISQSFNEEQRIVQLEFDRISNERDEMSRQVQVTQGDNNRLVQEQKNMELKHQISLERFRHAEVRWEEAQKFLLEQIAVQKEQLTGKRALWMEANPRSSARRDAMKAIRDPFNSPTAHPTASHKGSVMGSLVSPSVANLPQGSFGSNMFGAPSPYNNMKMGNNFHLAGGSNASQFGAFGIGGLGSAYNTGSSKAPSPGRSRNMPSAPPTRPTPRRGTLLLPSGAPPFGSGMQPAFFNSAQSHFMMTTAPRTEVNFPTTALVLHNSHDQLAAEYKVAITKLYKLLEDWVAKYSNEPCSKNDRAIASGNDILWAYMMNCTYPGHRQDAHTHVVALLGDRMTRYWFVMRMATQYCVKDIMSIEAFKPYSTSVDRIITEMLLKLQERGLNNEARQHHIDQGSQAVQSVVAANDYLSFRAQQLNFHTKGLRDILGPMLNDEVARADAGKDLGEIVVHAWDLSVKMHTARLTFQIYFPETASKFTASTMKSMDRPKADPMQLQIQQARLKLVITPVITMRDDKGTTIKAKALHSADVLLMG